MNDEITKGTLVKLTHTGRHNSDCKKHGYKIGITCQNHELGEEFMILDIVTDEKGDLGYKVKCEKGITFLRRAAFKTIKTAGCETNYDYLIPLLQTL